jgi:O-antigen/teichoic acid export membrane protein
MSRAPQSQVVAAAAAAGEMAVLGDITAAMPPADRTGPILRTAAALFSVQGITWAASFIGILLIPRFLGAHDLGVLATLTAVIGISGRLAGMGMAKYITREVARDPARATALATNAIAGRLALSTAFLVISTLTALALGASTVVLALLMCISAGNMAGSVTEVLTAALQGNQTMGRAAAATSILSLVVQIAIVGALFAGGGLLPLVLLSAAGAIATMAVIAVIFAQRFGWERHWDVADATRLGIAGFPFLIWDLGLLVYGSVDLLLVPFLTNVETAGQYAFAYRLASVPIFFATVVTAAIFPALSNAALVDFTWFRRLLTRTAVLTYAGTLPLSLGLIMLAPQLAQEIGGGNEFARSVPLIIILSFHIPLAAIDTILGSAIFALNRQKSFAVIAWSAALLNPMANLIAVPLAARLWGNGAIGAAAITFFTEAFMGVCLFRLIHRSLLPGQLISGLARASLAGAAMVVPVLLTANSAGVVPAIAVGAVVYASVALLLRLGSVSELARMRSAFGTSSG